MDKFPELQVEPDSLVQRVKERERQSKRRMRVYLATPSGWLIGWISSAQFNFGHQWLVDKLPVLGIAFLLGVLFGLKAISYMPFYDEMGGYGDHDWHLPNIGRAILPGLVACGSITVLFCTLYFTIQVSKSNLWDGLILLVGSAVGSLTLATVAWLRPLSYPKI